MLVIYAATTAAAGFAVYKLGSGVPFPSKWPWVLGSAMVFLYSLACLLYTTGGRWTMLLPVFFPARVAIQTTGTLALAVAAYGAIEGPDKISAQWYALPTGCAPLAMVYQYVPPVYIQAVFAGAILAYAARAGSPFVLPCGALLASAAISFLDVTVAVLDNDMLVLAAQVASVFMFSILATGGKIKTK